MQVVHGNRGIRHREKTVGQLGRREKDTGQETEVGGQLRQRDHQQTAVQANRRG